MSKTLKIIYKWIKSNMTKPHRIKIKRYLNKVISVTKKNFIKILLYL